MTSMPRDPQALPLVVELLPPPDPAAAFARLARQRKVLFLDSAQRQRELGRYSFLTCDPFDYWQAPADGSDALGELERRLQPWQHLAATEAQAGTAELPPFTGGAAGLLSYDLGRSLERVPLPAYDEFELPALAMGLYDTVLAFDHVAQRAWIISHGFPETTTQGRRERAAARIKQFQGWLQQPVAAARDFLELKSGSELAEAQLAPSYPLSQLPGLLSNFTAKKYLASVQRAIDYIYAGDIFQVNLSQRLLHRAVDDAAALYLRLRDRNPATFMAYFDLGQTQIASASPERFVQIRNGLVETRPIKGTRPRARHAVADLFTGDELQASAKDRAENVMIVDLLRNDLSRVCAPDSVRVTQLCGLETYEFVQHLVSAVEGRLAVGKTSIDAIRGMFPGGSITGAPKVRAMEIISELEPTARGAYCGSLGYLGFNGNLDLSILIRTIVAARGWWQFPVGGGIVAASHPQREYEETWHKATGLLRAMK